MYVFLEKACFLSFDLDQEQCINLGRDYFSGEAYAGFAVVIIDDRMVLVADGSMITD